MTTTPADQPPHQLPAPAELAPPVTTIGARSTATLATDLAALMESGGPDGPHGWGLYHAIIDTLCKRHPEVQAAWEAWADAEDRRVPSANAVLAAVRTLLTAPADQLPHRLPTAAELAPLIDPQAWAPPSPGSSIHYSYPSRRAASLAAAHRIRATLTDTGTTPTLLTDTTAIADRMHRDTTGELSQLTRTHPTSNWTQAWPQILHAALHNLTNPPEDDPAPLIFLRTDNTPLTISYHQHPTGLVIDLATQCRHLTTLHLDLTTPWPARPDHNTTPNHAADATHLLGLLLGHIDTAITTTTH
ncbi:hypothetical protein ACWDUL_33610 [Nocardia niigatensis]